MSKIASTPVCQPLVTKLEGVLSTFSTQIKRHFEGGQPTVKVQLRQSQLALFLGYAWSTGPTLALLSLNSKRATNLLSEIAAWQISLGQNQPWYFLNDQLSEAEWEGTISTDLTLAYHFLLGYSSQKRNFLVLHSQSDIVIPDPEKYQSASLVLQVGQKSSLAFMTEFLIKQGYIRQTTTLEPGTVRVRGEIIDVAHPALPGHYTITFYGQNIESIVYHDDRRSVIQQTLRIPPIRFPKETATLASISQKFRLIRPTLAPDWPHQGAIIYDALASDLSFPVTELHSTANLKEPIILYSNVDRVQSWLADQTIFSPVLDRSPLANFTIGLEVSGTPILTEAYILPTADQTDSRPVSYEEGLTLLAELTPGKPAVHADHGIGIYEGLVTRTIGDTTQEYLVLRYGAGDSLSVPVEYAHKVTAYLGETTPTLHRLGGTLWDTTKRQARAEAADLAAELLATASQRQANPGVPYAISEILEAGLAQTFPYQLTPDQDQTWEAIKNDLGAPTPMDRLIVGDVGFGKTEIAIRAAAQVTANGYQVAVLAPTTLLVQQHADTFKDRLKDFKYTIGVLSRFSTHAEQTQTRAGLADGSIQIAIGTHALLSKSTTWKNLGLVIIDEEQRFGVQHKEHFKKLRATVDLLSLSATPIPRTLSMSLTGLKQLSIISTAPKGRKSVESYVGPETDEKLQEALERELTRGGQVYVVSPRIRGLGSLARQIHQLVPTAKVATAHGQLPSQQLAEIMGRFDRGDIDVLVSSTIVENGLDLPNANTLIVMQATRYGLSELYQLRGRVGRRERQGYAYFFYNHSELTSLQRQRLTALTEASRLGSGWLLAQRDLEIRGAGSLLGAQQSGTVNAIGIQLYLDMVQEAMHGQQELTIRRHEVDIHLPLIAIIPQHYMADSEQRTKWYQKLSRANSLEQLNTHVERLIKRFGPLPAEVQNLHLLLQLQHAAAALGITAISSQVITPTDEDPYARLIVKGPRLPNLLIKLEPLGNWEVRHNSLTINVDDITPQLLQKIIDLV